MLSIVMTRVMVGAEAIDSTPKTNAGVRRISLDRRLVDDRSHKAPSQPTDSWLAKRGRKVAPCRRRSGVPILPQTISRRFDGLVRRGGGSSADPPARYTSRRGLDDAGGRDARSRREQNARSLLPHDHAFHLRACAPRAREAGERQTEALASVAGSSVDKALTWESQKSQDKGVSTAFPQVRTGVGGGT